MTTFPTLSPQNEWLIVKPMQLLMIFIHPPDFPQIVF